MEALRASSRGLMVRISDCNNAANKRTLQKLENLTEDLEKAQQELKQLKENKDEKN